MKLQVDGRVVGNELKKPDPKGAPLTEVGMVKLELLSQAISAERSSKAVLIVEKDAMERDFKLGTFIRITIVDTQQTLLLDAGEAERPEPERSTTPASKPATRGRRERGGIVSLPGSQGRE